MRTATIERGVTFKAQPSHKCGCCSMAFYQYKHLVQHLYWRHGTESNPCNECGVRRWHYAPHVCHVLPIDGSDVAVFEDAELAPARESQFCYCGQHVPDAAMIGCDDPGCALQWYHFACVGVFEPPDGNWFCPTCIQAHSAKKVDET